MLKLDCKHCGYVFNLAEKKEFIGGQFKPTCPKCGRKSIFNIDKLPKHAYSISGTERMALKTHR
jgi:rubredoxin